LSSLQEAFFSTLLVFAISLDLKRPERSVKAIEPLERSERGMVTLNV
jgi:hypothetical protein